MRSRRTTVAGLSGGLAMLILVLDERLGLRLGDDVRTLLLTVVAGGIAGLGLTARDDAITSEGTRAALRRRDRGGGAPS